MKFQKITSFLDINSNNNDLPKFVTKKWIEVYDQSQGNYDSHQESRINISMLRSDLFDSNDAYIVGKGNITVNKKHLLLMNLKHLIIQQLMQMLLIMQMIMRLTKKSWFF